MIVHVCLCVFAIAFKANVSSQTRARKWCARKKGRERSTFKRNKNF